MKGTAMFRRVVLIVLVVAAGARLLGFVVRFGRESVQLDFAAFYTAGEARSHGLSPYRTYADHDPPIWDGVDVFAHSRFLYPPLAATLFRPLAALPYAVAKWVWMIGIVACLALALREATLALRLRMSAETALGVAAFTLLFHPLLALLERGQVDALTLVLILAALRPLVRDGRETPASGVLLAVATLFKLNVAVLVPFLILRRRFRVLAGYVAGGLVLLAVSVGLDGPGLWSDYVSRELPRISRFGERGTADMRLAPEVLSALRKGLPEGQVVRDGRVYRLESFGYVANASLAWVVSRRGGEEETPARVALGLLAVWVAVMALGPWRRSASTGGPVEELAYWQAAMTGILLCGPLTWAMNTVWLVPIALTLAADLGSMGTAEPGEGRAREGVALAVVALGLLLAALPDQHAFPLIAPYAATLLNHKYVAAEALILAGLLALLSVHPERGTGGEAGNP